MTFKPMLAGKAPELELIRYPVLASPKLDGIRCVILDGAAMSRNLKPIPSDFVREQLRGLPNGIDGELMVEGGFNACQSAFMSKTWTRESPDFWFFAFDWHGAPHRKLGDLLGFQGRLEALTRWSEENGHNNLHVVQHVLVRNEEELRVLDALHIEQGFEGTMVRAQNGPYKFGRSTTREGFLLKIKLFEDEEAEVIGVVERMHNDNEQERDELGRAKRSSAKAGKRPAGDLGALVCRTPDGAEFEIGSGFTAAQRVELWEMSKGSGTWPRVTFKHQPDPGGRKPGQAPRFPVFKGFRHGDDL